MTLANNVPYAKRTNGAKEAGHFNICISVDHDDEGFAQGSELSSLSLSLSLTFNESALARR